jgi:hypothetical protein
MRPHPVTRRDEATTHSHPISQFNQSIQSVNSIRHSICMGFDKIIRQAEGEVVNPIDRNGNGNARLDNRGYVDENASNASRGLGYVISPRAAWTSTSVALASSTQCWTTAFA